MANNNFYLEAEKIIEKVLNIDGNNIEALNELAALYIKDADFEEAQKYLTRVLKLDQSNEVAIKHLSDLKQKVIEYHRINIAKDEKYSKEKKIISVHLPKCGGTSFRIFLENVYGNALFPDYERNLMHGFALAMTKNTRCVHGHFLANKYDNIFPFAWLITWVRDPVQRVMSEYHHCLRYPQDNNLSRLVNENKLSIVEFAELKIMHNRMTYYLAGKTLSDFDFVGIMEFYEESLEQFCELIGISCPKTIPRVNINENRQNAKYEISEAEQNEILRFNSLDLAFYQSALDVFHSNPLNS